LTAPPTDPKTQRKYSNSKRLPREKYQDIFETHRESFHPFIASAYGMHAPEATQILQHLAHITADKTQKPYSAIVKHLRLSIAITLVKAAQHCFRASRKKHHHATTNNTPTSHQNPVPNTVILGFTSGIYS
jgi:hypothetical protein